MAGLGLHRYVTSLSNKALLQQSAETSLGRAERAIDHIFVSSIDLLLSGTANCNAQNIEYLRQLVVATGLVSDVFLITEQRTCSSFGDNSVGLPSLDERNEWTPALNPAYRLEALSPWGNDLLAISWGLGTNVEMVVLLSTDAILFDALPEGIRDNGRIDLMAGQTELFGFLGNNVAKQEGQDWPAFSATGERYSLSVVLKVKPESLQAWRSTVLPTVAGVWTVLGSLVAAFTAFVLNRTRSAVLFDIQVALARGEIYPCFQPIVRVSDGAVIGCEALARWRKPNGDEVSPDNFVPIVERYKLDDELLQGLLAQTAKSLGNFLAESPDFYVGFNVTPDQLSRPDFADFMIETAKKHLLRPAQICVEITERQAISAPDIAKATTDKLTAAGFIIAIDDAGTGHNGLATIQLFEAGVVKIDKFFIDQIEDDPRAAIMVDMFASVAGRYNMRTVAEGIENAYQIRKLRSAGVYAMQGYFFSKPVPAQEFELAMETCWGDFARQSQSRQWQASRVIALG